MKSSSKVPETVAAYISQCPRQGHTSLRLLRAAIKKAAPQAIEKISYMMPAYAQEGALVYFAGYEQHIGFYPGAEAIQVFKKDLTKFEVSKGTIRFPIDQPVPLGLVTRIVKFRVRTNLEKLKKKMSKKKVKKKAKRSA